MSRWLVVLAMVAGCSAAGVSAADSGVPLIWHVETGDGKAVDSHDADKPVNPASVVKLATTLRALDTLGADHRFTTTFGLTGTAAAGDRFAGNLVVDGGADPDFHFENALVVAHALAESGLTRVHGDMYVGPTFWIGWERGTAGREPDPIRRRIDMGHRLVQSWSPSSWSPEQRQSWMDVATRHGWDKTRPPEVHVDGSVRAEAPPAWRPLAVHRSEPLVVALRRFNVYSNNDIERLDASIGPASELPAFLARRWGKDASVTSFSTSSGLNRNRMTPRLVVRLLHDLRAWLSAHGLGPADVMPVFGCGESTLFELFPRLRASGEANGMAGKTGTLNMQDGGVSALAGFLPAAGTGLVFFVAAPGAGDELPRARAAEEDWVRRVLLSRGHFDAGKCPEPVPTSDARAEMASKP